MKTKTYLFLILMSVFFASCRNYTENDNSISFNDYKIAEGFEIQLAASEPLIEAPVAMDFDNEGRMWVVEMRGFMPNIAGSGEDVPNGRISILYDLNKEGTARSSKVFLDSLVLPRALALVYGGLLYAAPPNLWFVEINNDKPGKKILVDSIYADEFSNPENQANGLMMGIDNWIYSAYSTNRYQFKNEKWVKEPTSFRGQFGMTKDNFGRLYYSYNELQLAGDYVLPNSFIDNHYMKPKEAINKDLTKNQHIFPLHATTVNRGYVEGILNKDSVLVKFTAACGPVIYRGNQYPEEYNQNAFVCEPEANLIKRNIVTFGKLQTVAEQAWDDREFISSTDEGFRPVNLVNGPDGAIYVVDMHRGIMQHIVSATPYYRNSIVQKKLDTLMNAGRILRIKNKDRPLEEIPDLRKSTCSDLVALLKSPNGWVRDQAQRSLINNKCYQSLPGLLNLMGSGKDTLASIHALRTLEGLDTLNFGLLLKAASYKNSMLTAHALLILKSFNRASNIRDMEKLSRDLIARNDTTVDLYLACSLGPWAAISPKTFLPLLLQLSHKYRDDPVIQEAVVSSLTGLEVEFKARLAELRANQNSEGIMENLLVETIKNKAENKPNSIFVHKTIPVPGLQKGLVIYRSTCAGCHGAEGEGIEHIAPPLNGSEYVAGTTARLAMIILYGLEGPVHVKGQLYEFNGSMPGFKDNFTDEEVAGIIDYLHNSFVAADPKLSYGRKRVQASEITSLRNKRTGSLTEQDLLKMSE